MRRSRSRRGRRRRQISDVVAMEHINFIRMKRGFNKYGNVGEDDDSFSDSNNQPNQNQPTFNLMNQLSNFSAGNNGFSDTMIVTLFQIVEQQSQALQSLMSKVETITQRTVELTEKIK